MFADAAAAALSGITDASMVIYENIMLAFGALSQEYVFPTQD